MKDKRSRRDVQEFERNLMDNIISLHKDLVACTYVHSSYQAFNISDPKPRNIHKATVRDRLLHHALYRKLYPFFDRTFIFDSYSCRKGKGTHRAMNRFHDFACVITRNHTCTGWILKCDVKKFFASINHLVLIDIIKEYMPDRDIVWLLSHVIGSFHSTHEGVGLPLGNLTSQLLVNVYMNKFDQYVKHTLKAKYYIRYADDFVILSRDRAWLQFLLPQIQNFLFERLHLTLHPNKVSLETVASGIDFLGWVHFIDHRTVRTTTKRRMFNRLLEEPKEASVQSYLGLLSHGNAKKLQRRVMDALEKIKIGSDEK